MDSAEDSDSAHCGFKSECCQLAELRDILEQGVHSMFASAWRGDGHQQAATCPRHATDHPMVPQQP